MVLAGLSVLGIMAGYEEIANLSAGIGSDIAKRAGTKILSQMRLPCFACHSR